MSHRLSIWNLHELNGLSHCKEITDFALFAYKFCCGLLYPQHFGHRHRILKLYLLIPRFSEAAQAVLSFSLSTQYFTQ